MNFGLGIGKPPAAVQTGVYTNAESLTDNIALTASGGAVFVLNYTLISYDKNGFHFINSIKPDNFAAGTPLIGIGLNATTCVNCGGRGIRDTSPPPGPDSVTWILRAAEPSRKWPF